MSEGRLKGKVAVVTGSSRGLGKAIALGFAREGASLVINYLSNIEAAKEVADSIIKIGGKAVTVCADVSIRKDVKDLLFNAHKEFGKVDILVNNAGINKRGWFNEITDEDWDMIMTTNLKGPFICSQEVFPYMIKNGGGRIINISSVAGQYHGPKTVHYAVSKAGLNSLTKVLARYGAEHNILINAVAPGLILTDQTQEEFESGAANSILDLTLLKRPGNEQDVVSACLSLADPGQNYMTGQVLAVSGGAYLG
ncbi:3-oxoacyl-ACP reductase FabG [Polynucleobacter paneuropaeus]|nr:3-oxoacyl-ACP reductase FabG [Polynucleobacter paneuropaeus]